MRFWYDRSAVSINKALDALPKDADALAINRAINEAYQFDPDEEQPWRAWREARCDILASRFPALFPPKRKEVPKGEGLF